MTMGNPSWISEPNEANTEKTFRDYFDYFGFCGFDHAFFSRFVAYVDRAGNLRF